MATLQQLSAYLAYKAKIQKSNFDKDIIQLTVENIGLVFSKNDKLILRTLSDLTKEITHNGETFIPFEKIEIYKKNGVNYLIEQIINGFVEWIVLSMLLEWHFDVFGLIDKGEAVDYNSIFNE